MRRVVAALGAALFVVVACASFGAARAADDRTATDGTRSLSVSAVHDLNPSGETLRVEGSGYDMEKGIYIAFCLIPPAGQPPTPCGGGQDRAGSSGESNWISNNPPAYATGLTEPYGPNGSFSVQVAVKAMLNENIDCRSARCAIVTRNDHTRGSDRSQDLIIPIDFRAAAPAGNNGGGGATTTTLTPATLPTTTTTALAPQFAAPIATTSDDGLSISGGGKTLSSSAIKDLGTRQEVTVKGQGFDPAKGVYVALCAVPQLAGAPGPCLSGSASSSAWISSSPPDYGKALAKPYGDGGSFSVALTLDPVIDSEHDCRTVACAITTRNDDTNEADRSQDLLLPVSFTDADVRTTASSKDAEDGSNLLVRGVAALVVFGLAGGAYVLIRRRGASA